MNRYHLLPDATVVRIRQTSTVLTMVLATFVVFIAALVSSSTVAVCEANAQQASERPNVLVIDAGLGDCDLVIDRWLGDEVLPIAFEDGFELDTANTPAWWREDQAEGPAPNTFVLSNPDGLSAFKPSTLTWALDRIGDTGSNPKSIVVSTVATGLPVREYVEGLASQKLADRNDVAALVFCGTPHNGYTAIEKYPEIDIWNTIAGTVGLSVDDLKPSSDYLGKLAGSALPAGIPVLNVSGIVGDLRFGPTDGAGVASDFKLEGLSPRDLTSRQVRSSAAQALGLSQKWHPFASHIDYQARAVDLQVAERVSAQPSYLISSDVIYQTSQFYGSVVEPDSAKLASMTVLALDLSGSMYDQIDESTNKLAAAKEAAKEYLQAVRSRNALPEADLIGVAVIGFNVEANKIATGYDQSACDAIDAAGASGETDIGLALDEALAEMRTAPDAAIKRVLLLSDGASTQGKGEQGIFATSIAEAKDAGIIIDTIGFGDIGESDAGFLQRVASATGGSSYQATDTSTLKMDFYMSYSSLMRQAPVDQSVVNAHPRTDNSLLLLVIVALVFVVLLALTIALTLNGMASGASAALNRNRGDTRTGPSVPPTGN